MKRLFSVFLLVLIAISPLSAYAQNRLVSISKLFAQCSSGWHRAYETKWRTVDIDMDYIDVPAADKLPVFTVKIMDYPSSEKLSELNMSILYPHLTEQQLGITVEVGKPSLVENTTKKRYEYEDYHNYFLEQLESIPLSAIYAVEGAGYSAQAAKTQFFDIVEKLWGHDVMNSLRLDKLFTQGRLLELGKGKSVARVLRNEGNYQFNFQQCFEGIPLLPDYLNYSGNIRGEQRAPYQQVYFYSYSEYDYAFSVNLLGTTEKKHEDIPVLALSSIQSTIEELILAGNLRSIEEMSFGYLIYLDPKDTTQYWTVPTWAISCGWCDSPRSPSDKTNLERIYIDAQTGMMLDPNSRKADRRHVPVFITWDDVK